MSAPITPGDLDAATWWARSELSEDSGEPSYWIRRIVVEVVGDGDGTLLEVAMSDEGGPTVDVLTEKHTVTDMRALAAVLSDLAARVAALPISRLPA